MMEEQLAEVSEELGKDVFKNMPFCIQLIMSECILYMK